MGRSRSKAAQIREEVLKIIPPSERREENLPEFLRDTVTSRSRRGKVGQIHVRRYTGVVNNTTARILREIEQRAGGTEAVLSILALADPMPTGIRKMLEISKLPGKKRTGVARLCAEAGADPASIITNYTKGLVLLNQQEALRDAAEAMPRAVRELIRLATPRTFICRTCLGVGMIPSDPSKNLPEKACPTCGGSKEEIETDEKQEFAIKELKELAGMGQKAPQVQINNTKNTQNNLLLGGQSLAATVREMNDRLLFGQPQVALPPAPAPEVIEAEVVEKEKE